MELARVVLVRPRIAGNLGATARVMRNMGLVELVLAAPEADPTDRRALRRSTRGESILRQARRVDDLAEAVAGCVLVVGTSARTGGLFRRQSVGSPETIMPLAAELLEAAPVALVFGPEATGLSNAEVACCHHLVHIATDPSYRTLNVAQAVGICLYELRRAWVRRGDAAVAKEMPASFADQEQMFSRVREALEAVHFLYGPKADALMHAIRHLIGRAGPTAMEVGVLTGLARQIRWYVDQHSPGPPALDKPGPGD
jgi:tRNA/rRNA methyltransferase